MMRNLRPLGFLFLITGCASSRIEPIGQGLVSRGASGDWSNYGSHFIFYGSSERYAPFSTAFWRTEYEVELNPRTNEIVIFATLSAEDARIASIAYYGRLSADDTVEAQCVFLLAPRAPHFLDWIRGEPEIQRFKIEKPGRIDALVDGDSLSKSKAVELDKAAAHWLAGGGAAQLSEDDRAKFSQKCQDFRRLINEFVYRDVR